MTELQDISLIDNCEDDTQEILLIDNTDLRQPSIGSTDKTKWCLGFFVACTFVMMLLWLAESQFSNGILRQRYVGEPCAWSLFGKKKCADPLKCRLNKCVAPDKTITIRNPNCTGLIEPNDCQACPTCRPCQNLVSYFDFNEFPNHWLGRLPGDRTKIILGMNYGGCKEVCASDPTCKLICFNGISNICHTRLKYTFPGVRNMSWTCAIKII